MDEGRQGRSGRRSTWLRRVQSRSSASVSVVDRLKSSISASMQTCPLMVLNVSSPFQVVTCYGHYVSDEDVKAKRSSNNYRYVVMCYC